MQGFTINRGRVLLTSIVGKISRFSRFMLMVSVLTAGKVASIEEAVAEMETGGDQVDGAPTTRERLLKFEVQMYRLREGEYVVDFQVPTTDPLAPIKQAAPLACMKVHWIADHLICKKLK